MNTERRVGGDYGRLSGDYITDRRGFVEGRGVLACGKIMRGRQNVGGNGVKDARRIFRV